MTTAFVLNIYCHLLNTAKSLAKLPLQFLNMNKVEKVIVNGEFRNYRLVVGTTREAIDEYLKLKESPA